MFWRRSGAAVIVGAIVATGVTTAWMLTGGGPAAGGTIAISPTSSAQGFNVVVESDATLTTSEDEGPVAIGGDLTLGGSYNVANNHVGTFIAPGDTVPSSLVIGGEFNVAGSGNNVLKVLQGHVNIGSMNNTTALWLDSNSAQVNTEVVPLNQPYDTKPNIALSTRQDPALVGPTSPFPFATAFTDFRSDSTAMNSCANNVTLLTPNGPPADRPITSPSSIHITLTANTTNVLNMTGDELNNSSFTFNNSPSSTQPIIINVSTGPTFDWNVQTSAGASSSNAPFIIYNFPDASSIMQMGAPALEGTIYAPNANFIDTSGGDIEGQVIASQYTADGGEVHYFPFTAPLSCDSVAPSMSPSVSPSTSPSASPSTSPSASPSTSPSASPSMSPSASPSMSPSASPSMSPSMSPSASPSVSPSMSPSASPSVSPSMSPSASPSMSPSASPSMSPSASPSMSPSVSPSPSTSGYGNPTSSPSMPGYGYGSPTGRPSQPGGGYGYGNTQSFTAQNGFVPGTLGEARPTL